MGYNTRKMSVATVFALWPVALVESGQWSSDAVEHQMSHQERKRVRAAYIHGRSISKNDGR